MQDKKMTTCPHCGKVVKKGNFCSYCAGKLIKECDCWVLHRKFNCGLAKCPGYKLLVLLLKTITFVEKFQYSGYGIIIKPLNKKFFPKSKFARAYMADIAENLKDWDEEAK